MRRGLPDAPGFGRLDIVRAVAVMAALVVVAGAAMERRSERSSRPPAGAPETAGQPTAGWRYPPPGTAGPEEEPLASEENVFRVRARELGVAPDLPSEARGHIRSLEIYRRVRAYPGAPPRIPHGLTEEEFRRVTCNVCHRRGGWVARFGTYAPVTPHPDQTSCLQCHVPLDELVGRPLSDAGSVVCSQCHVDPDAPPRTFVDSDWGPAAWPETDQRAMAGSPHLIPHDVESRGNCLACHSGPGAVAEIRTDHPERVSCRQCHVPAGTGRGLWPPADDVGRGSGGTP